MTQATCSIPGCPKPHRARGLCSTHYNQQHQVVRHRKVTMMCGWCGRPTDKSPDTARGYQYRFCSLSCRDTWRRRDKLPVIYVGNVVRPRQPRPARPRAPRIFVCGSCTLCGATYVAEDYTNTARFCSVRCMKRAGRDRYRARKRNAYVADVWRERVFQRDGWRCRICRKKVRRDKVVPHPLAPVLDHIVPLARGGTHEPANAQCAHYLCNSIKSDSLAKGAQLLLFG